jgi:hypothetical protein
LAGCEARLLDATGSCTDCASPPISISSSVIWILTLSEAALQNGQLPGCRHIQNPQLSRSVVQAIIAQRDGSHLRLVLGLNAVRREGCGRFYRAHRDFRTGCSLFRDCHDHKEDCDPRRAGSHCPVHRVGVARFRVFLFRVLLPQPHQRHRRDHRFFRPEAQLPAVHPKELRPGQADATHHYAAHLNVVG